MKTHTPHPYKCPSQEPGLWLRSARCQGPAKSFGTNLFLSVKSYTTPPVCYSSPLLLIPSVLALLLLGTILITAPFVCFIHKLSCSSLGPNAIALLLAGYLSVHKFQTINCMRHRLLPVTFWVLSVALAQCLTEQEPVIRTVHKIE
jgi:hypothetical protein